MRGPGLLLDRSRCGNELSFVGRLNPYAILCRLREEQDKYDYCENHDDRDVAVHLMILLHWNFTYTDLTTMWCNFTICG